MELICLKIKNWEKYNPRKDYKKPWWFALDNRLIESSDFFSFSPIEFKAWIYFLSMASQVNKEKITVNVDHADRVCGIEKKHILSCIKKLEQLSIVTTICTEPVQNLYRTRTESVLHITEQNSTEQYRTNNLSEKSSDESSHTDFNFEFLYQKYPLKKGKAKGVERLKRIIKQESDFQDFSKAVERYTQDIQSKGTEPRFIQHFSTFVGSEKLQPWRDWLQDDAGSAIAVLEQKKPTSFAEQKIKNNDAALEAYKKKLRGEISS